MRITVDIDDETLEQAMKLTGKSKKGPAITRATTEFVRREMVKTFADMVMAGEFADYPLTKNELEASDRGAPWFLLLPVPGWTFSAEIAISPQSLPLRASSIPSRGGSLRGC